ncbi:MAG: NAD(P)H-dependent oxidoreductase [Bdellovibrionales bacterium]|nr:NAD(P)H-dependent oxidoreductase [Bdellovibrionales bacterium]
MRRVLFQFAHPTPKQSRANRAILDAVRKQAPEVTISDLYSKYPNFDIDVQEEQKLLLEHDDIFFQHPFYWYSMPPLLKLWMDDVLEWNFAYGPDGTALKGKGFHLSITTGGSVEAYQPAGVNRFAIESFFPTYDQTAYLCGMTFHKPIVLHHAGRATDEGLRAHAEMVVKYLKYLQNCDAARVADPDAEGICRDD